MKRILRHLIIPAVVSTVFLIIAAMPVQVMGCRNRGLLAVLVALIGGLAGLGAVIMGAIRKMRSDPNAGWWMASTLILVIPAVVIIIIAL